jgi:hypothetical protein
MQRQRQNGYDQNFNQYELRRYNYSYNISRHHRINKEDIETPWIFSLLRRLPALAG